MEVSFYVNLQSGTISFVPPDINEICGEFKQNGAFTLTHMSIFSSVVPSLGSIFTGWIKITNIIG